MWCFSQMSQCPSDATVGRIWSHLMTLLLRVLLSGEHLIPEITRANLPSHVCIHQPNLKIKIRNHQLSHSRSLSPPLEPACVFEPHLWKKKKNCCTVPVLIREKTEKKVKVVAAWALCFRTLWRFYMNVWRVWEELEQWEVKKPQEEEEAQRNWVCVFCATGRIYHLWNWHGKKSTSSQDINIYFSLKSRSHLALDAFIICNHPFKKNYLNSPLNPRWQPRQA